MNNQSLFWLIIIMCFSLPLLFRNFISINKYFSFPYQFWNDNNMMMQNFDDNEYLIYSRFVSSISGASYGDKCIILYWLLNQLLLVY